MHLLARIPLIIFSLIPLGLCLFFTSVSLEYVQMVQSGDKVNAEIIEVLEMKLGNGVYLASVENSFRTDTVYSKDFLMPYRPGTKLFIYQHPERSYLFQWKNTHMIIGALLLPFLLFVMLFSIAIFPPDPVTRNTSKLTVVCFWSFWGLIGYGLLTISIYGYYHDQIFYNNSIKTTATVQGYQSKHAKDEDGDYTTIYAAILKFNLENNIENTVVAEYRNTKQYKFGQQIDIYYLKSNPDEISKREKDKTKIFLVFLTLLGIGLIALSYWGIKNKIAVQVE